MFGVFGLERGKLSLSFINLHIDALDAISARTELLDFAVHVGKMSGGYLTILLQGLQLPVFPNPALGLIAQLFDQLVFGIEPFCEIENRSIGFRRTRCQRGNALFDFHKRASRTCAGP